MTSTDHSTDRSTDHGGDYSNPECPTPGSAEARDLGCSCSAKRNYDGQRPPFPIGTHIGGSTGGWLMALDCSLHAASGYRGALLG